MVLTSLVNFCTCNSVKFFHDSVYPCSCTRIWYWSSSRWRSTIAPQVIRQRSFDPSCHQCEVASRFALRCCPFSPVSSLERFLEPSCHLLVFNLCIQTLELRSLIISQRSGRSEAGLFASPLRDTRTTAYCPWVISGSGCRGKGKEGGQQTHCAA